MKLHQSGNEIIVTELRSVSYVPQSEIVLISKNGMLKPGVYAGGGFVRFMDENYCGANIEDCEGWLPMPQYRPEATPIDPEGFRKGVKALFDYLQDRVANNYHANSDKPTTLEQRNR